MAVRSRTRARVEGEMTIAAIVYVLAWIGLCIACASYAAMRPSKDRSNQQ